jgi:hypothetical protein
VCRFEGHFKDGESIVLSAGTEIVQSEDPDYLGIAEIRGNRAFGRVYST